ncbi:MAG: lipoyl(octanoyl) transferase LipB [Bacteroidia bacterium]|jgi:lipoyl(octanoyl) transferase|nr:lipoyl(octanoyl) transferase LipB [Bacteroidia bacterium]
MVKEISFEDWGLIDYKEAWDKQENLFKEKVNLKFEQRSNPALSILPIPNHLVFCEHPHVYTLGKSGSIDNLLISAEQLKQAGATYYPINRGGDITYHGPGQIVGYPILDLEQFFTDIHKYLRMLEEAVILTLAEYEIVGDRLDGYTGVWLEPENNERARKICAMGVRCSRWITMHGFAFNVNTDLSYFDHIVPCGIDDKQVTSIAKELGKQIPIDDVKKRLLKHLCDLFQFTIH